MFQKTDSQNECNSVSSFGINYDIFHFQSPNFSLSDLYENNSIFDDWKKENQIQIPNSPNNPINNEIEKTRNKAVIQDPIKKEKKMTKIKWVLINKLKMIKYQILNQKKLLFLIKKNHLKTIWKKIIKQMKMIQQVEVVNLLVKRKRRKNQIKKT